MTHRYQIHSSQRIVYNYKLLFALSWIVVLSILNTTQTDALPIAQTTIELDSLQPSNDSAEETGGELHSETPGEDTLLPAHLEDVPGLCRPRPEHVRRVEDSVHYALSTFAEAEEYRMLRLSNNSTPSLAHLIHNGQIVCDSVVRKLGHIGQQSSCPWNYTCTHDIYRYPRYIVQASCLDQGRRCSSCVRNRLGFSSCRELMVENVPIFVADENSCGSDHEVWTHTEISIAIGCQCLGRINPLSNSGAH